MDLSAEQNLRNLADSELMRILDSLPKDPISKMTLFIDMMRFLDYFTVYKDSLPKEQITSTSESELYRLGWGMAIKHFFVDIGKPGIPVRESTTETRKIAAQVLYRLGAIAFLKNISDLNCTGLIDIHTSTDQITVTAREEITYQLMDALQSTYASQIDLAVRKNTTGFSNGWKIFSFDEEPDEIKAVGAFYGFNNSSLHKDKKIENVRMLMEPLIFPHDLGHGVMMGYGADPRVDNHFFSLALDWIREARDQAGLHPSVKINGISAVHIIVVTAVIIALHTKHITFADIALHKIKEISIPQSLTIWTTQSDLIDAVMAHTGFEKDLTSEILDIISFKISDLSTFKSGSYISPLLLDMGNGMFLRPVASILRNPFHSIIELLTQRDINTTNAIALPREDWLRSHIYYMFMGNRYKRVTGNIKLRNAGRTITDLDGAIYDTVSGNLALFQLKWQDYFVFDVKKLRSKAKNLASEIDSWGEAVESWLKDKTSDELVKTLRLKLPEGRSITRIYLFGISWSAFRVQGYGYSREDSHVACCNLPMFRRVRYSIGKSTDVFGDIFEQLLKEQTHIDENIKKESLDLYLPGIKVRLKDLFFSYCPPRILSA